MDLKSVDLTLRIKIKDKFYLIELENISELLTNSNNYCVSNCLSVSVSCLIKCPIFTLSYVTLSHTEYTIYQSHFLAFRVSVVVEVLPLPQLLVQNLSPNLLLKFFIASAAKLAAASVATGGP